MQENKIIKLSDRDHVLLRSQMYCGAMDETMVEDFFLEEKKVSFTKVSYVPGFLKIINEVIDNSIDEAIRTNFEFANEIKINISKDEIEIIDNGRGIDVKKMDGSEEYMPVAAFCSPRAGSNFTEDERMTIGMNGVGAYVTNVFSKLFLVETCDGSSRLKLTCKDNLGDYKFSVRKGKCKQGTSVKFNPDLIRFGMTEINPVYIDLIKQRLYNLSISYPKITFIFNKEKIGFKSPKTFVSLFSESFEMVENDKYLVAFMPSTGDEFKFFTYVDGLYLKSGGNHIDLIVQEVVERLREKISRKYKDIRPGDIKNRLQVVVFLKSFPNMKFESQTKEKLTNSYAEIRTYLNGIDYETLAQKLYKNEKVYEIIVESYKIREELKNRQEIKALQKTKKISNDKYLPPTERKKYLVLGEGDSAVGGISRILGRKQFGYFSLKGKPLNAFEVGIKKVFENEEFKTISAILELDLANPDTNMSYESVLIASDQDKDGIQIRGLLLTFFNRFARKMVKEGRIKVLSTPMMIAYKGKTIHSWFFNFDEYNEFVKKHGTDGFNFTYYKGLGTFVGPELTHIFNKVGLDKFIASFEYDEGTDKALDAWMKDSNAQARRDMLLYRSFDIGKM